MSSNDVFYPLLPDFFLFILVLFFVILSFSPIDFVRTWHPDTLVGMFLEVHFLFDVFSEEIPDLLVVDFQVGGVHQVLHVLARVNRLENVLERPEKTEKNVAVSYHTLVRGNV